VSAEIPVPPLRARVTDLAGLLPPDRARRLEATLARHEEATGNQIAVLTVPTTGGEPIEAFALRVVDAWKLGREGVDDGVLVVVADQDRAARIEVGYGLEGAIPDAIAKRVIEDVMIPRFRGGDFAGGIEAGVDAITKAARGEALPPPPRRSPRGGGGGDPLGLVFFAALLSSVLWLPFRGGKRRPLGALLGGLTAAGVTWLFLRVAFWSALAFGLGLLFGWMGPSGGGGRRGRSWGGGGFGGGGWSGGGGGWSGGGGGFGGGGASGRW
jgi:uncharacterized protein